MASRTAASPRGTKARCGVGVRAEGCSHVRACAGGWARACVRACVRACDVCAASLPERAGGRAGGASADQLGELPHIEPALFFGATLERLVRGRARAHETARGGRAGGPHACAAQVRAGVPLLEMVQRKGDIVCALRHPNQPQHTCNNYGCVDRGGNVAMVPFIAIQEQ